MSEPSEKLITYYKFTSCCDETEIFFSGSLAVVNNSPYKYIGTSPFVGFGGSLQPGYCYTVLILNSQEDITYPTSPSARSLQSIDTCEDSTCESCTTTSCSCPEGFTEVDGECTKIVTTIANYTGNLLTVTEGDKVISYTASGLRLYSDISSLTYPILGTGSDNATYTVKDNNGLGTLVSQLGTDVQSTLWGSWSPCATGSTGGRLNTVGVWSTNYPDQTELCFEYCVEPTATKQYLIGMAGDNAVRFYVDGTLVVNLDTPSSGSTANISYTRWHVFPITLTAGTHTIKICGYNNESLASFGAEIYDITLETFQSTLTLPKVSSPNCGNVPTDLEPYIIFSTKDMIGLQVPDPNNLGVWECPDGYTLDECQGVPVCTIEEKFTLKCPCFLLIPCDGITPAFTSPTSDLELYLNQFVSVTAGNFEGCVYVYESDEKNCENGIEVIINSETVCDCDTICYYIENAQGITYVQYVDDSDQLLQIVPTETAPWLNICSKVYPILSNTDLNYTILALGSCVNNLCVQKCFKLTDCENPLNIKYSTSFVLLPYAINNEVIKIAGFTECWTIEITEEDCDCAIDVSVVFSVRTCNDCKEIIAYKLTSCNGLYNTQYTYDNLSEYVGETLLTDCGCFRVELINYAPPSIQTISIITSFKDCFACERPYYRLTECTTEVTIDTFNDLSSYIGKIVKLANCEGCYEVELIVNPVNPSIVTVTNSYVTCLECITTAPCVCSNVRNDNATDYTYNYIDCYGEVQSVTVAPGKTSPKVCLIKWLEPIDCNCLIVATTVGVTVTYDIIFSTGTLINHRPSWEIIDVASIFYNGTQWVKTNSLGIPDYYLPPSDAKCPSGVWHPYSSIPTELPTTVVTSPCKSYYNFFGNCNNGVCPVTVNPKKGIKPGYNTPGCSIEKYEEISCKSAQILYREVLNLRYGISNCCSENDMYWLLKKELIDLAALYNPEYNCVSPNNCGCNQSSDSEYNSCNS